MKKNYPTFFSQKSVFFAMPFNAHHILSKVMLSSVMLFTVSLLNAQCPSPPGDPAVFGNNVWNIYGYNNSDLTLVGTEYAGYLTQPTLDFDSQNSWSQTSSPSNAEGWMGCTLDNESFTYVYKRKGFPCGSYTITMTSWDDAAVIYVDGVQQWSCATSSVVGSCSGAVGDIVLNENSEIEIRIREDGGNSFASITLVNNTPTIAGTLAASGSTTICANTKPGNITLSGNSAAVIKWQSAEDMAFTAGVTDIVSTSNVLTSTDMGRIAATRYYRAVVQDGSCEPQYTDPLEITVPTPVTYSNGIWDGIPTETTPLIIEDDMVFSTITACSCEVKNGKTLTIASGETLTVATSVTVETGSQLIIQDKASLVQLDDAAVNSGTVSVKRNSQPMKLYDYTYWSSPVQGNTLYDLSPLTAGDKYYRFDPINNTWVSIIGGAQVMEPGRGYIVRAPQGWAVNNESSGVYGGQFNGVPNNGVIPATIQKGAGTFNLIGNPYPSAIDIDLFLTDPDNVGIVDGTIYMWTHNTAISASIGNVGYNYTADDYAKYNLTGGVRSAAPAITGGSTPDGKIASGQGFFIEAATGLANGTYNVNFKNSMRVTGGNNNFYRFNQTTNQNAQVLEKNRLWIAASNEQGAYSEVLVGYITSATNGPDALFDGKPMASANVLSMYSINGSDNYSIQGRALPFTASDVVPLGYKTTIAGDFTITLEDFDGLFQDQNVYLFDRLNNTTHDLKAEAYTFNSAIGTFNDRFEIQYESALSVNNPSGSQNGFTVYSSNGQLSIKSLPQMTSVLIYDLTGRKVYQSGTINANEVRMPLQNLQHQMLIVKAVFEDGSTSYKKAMLN